MLAILAAVAALLMLLLTVIHLPPARARALAWVITALESRTGLHLSAERLSYNLLTGGVSLTNVRLTARDTPDAPFLTAARVTADVPLAAYTGRLILDDVSLTDARIVMSIDENGRSNLPRSSSTAPPPDVPRRLDLRGLRLSNVTFLYDDRQMPLRIEAGGIESSLGKPLPGMPDGARGPLAVHGGVQVQWAERALRVEPFETVIGFDGSNVVLNDLPLVTEIARMNVSGELHRVLDALSLELGLDGQVDLARATESWLPAPVPVSGPARVRGSIAGPTSALNMVVRFDAEAIDVGTEQALTASGELLLEPGRLQINRVMAAPQSGGEVHAAIDVPFGDAPFSINAAWQGVDARALLRAANVTPQPVATRLDGEAQYSSGPRRALTVKTDLAAIREAGATPLSGRVNATIAGPAWTLTHDLDADGLAIRGQASGAVNDEAFTRSTLSGPSTVVIASLAAADRALAPFGVTIPAALRDAGGGIEAEATLAGTLEDPRATVVARAQSFDVPGVGVSELTATINASRRAVEVSPFNLTQGETVASGEALVDLDRRTLSGTVRAKVPDLTTLQAEIPERWRVAGEANADATIGGTFDAPAIDVALTSPSLLFAGDTFESLNSQLRVTDTGIDVSSLDLSQDAGGRLHAQGRYGFDRTYRLVLDAEEMTWSGNVIGETPSRVTVRGRFEGEGALDRPLGAGTFEFDITGGLAGDLVGQGTLGVDLFGEIARLNATLPALGAFANATVATSTPYDYRATAVVNRLDLARLTPVLEVMPGELTGQITLTAAAFGTATGDTAPQVQANIQQLEAQVGGVPITLYSPATVDWRQGGALIARGVTARVGTVGTLEAEGTWSDQANTSFSGFFRGQVDDVAQVARALGVATEVSPTGWLETTFYGTNNRNDFIASLDLTGGAFATADGVKGSSLTTSAGIKGETLTLHTFSGRLEAARASGTFAGSGKATIPDLDPKLAVGTFALDTASFDSAGIEVKQSRPSTISVDKGIVTLEDVVWGALGTELAVAGSVDASGSTPALNLSVKGVAALRVISAFLRNVGVDGTADVDVRLGGTTAEPDLSGTVTLIDAEVALASPRIVLSELAGKINLNSNRIDFGGLQGSANGGSLVIDGGVRVRGFELTGGEVHIQASGMAIEYPRGLRSEVDALITYDVDEATPALRGDVRVQRGSYTQPISLAALARANNQAAVRPPSGDSALDDMRLDIAVTTVEDLRVDNNYGRFEGGAQLRLVGTVGQPGMSGQVTLREGGQVFAAGRTFTLSRGAIAFTDLTRIQPDLDVQAVTRVSNLGDVTMTISGTPDQLEFDLTSEENATQDEIASALLGGGVTGANAAALLSSDILGATGRQIGLDALRIDRGDVITDEFREDPSQTAQDQTNIVTRLTLSKRLRDNVEFTASQNLAQNGKTTFIVSYYPLRNLELRLVSRDDGTQGAGIRHQITFGADRPATVAAPRTILTVKDVRLEGTIAPLSPEVLRKELRVKAGATFNYFDWQHDLDELAARYVERGFYEARVRGRREEAGDNGLIVVYAVTPGVPTRIEVEGLEVPEQSLNAIRQTWSRGVFDRFIVEDAESEIQRVLLGRGFVNGTVTGTMETDASGKTLRLAVVPGSVTGGRSMRFSGNSGLDQNTLETAMLQWGMADYGWIDREMLARTLEDYYRTEGYLQPSVTVDAPIQENGRGILPVHITEGPRAVIRQVTWSGISESQQGFTERSAALQAGEPYTLATVDAARERVERRYRTLGHNAVAVAAATIPSEDRTQVDIAITVSEGPQQLLQEVETVGTTRTREGVVARALRLTPGQPVNLAEWSLARKRLYDTNVFRAVDIQAVPLGDPVDGVQQVKARVTVEEYLPWRFRYGLQVDREEGDEGVSDTDLNLGVIGEIRNQNIFGRALTGGVATRIEKDYQRANTFLQSATFLGLPLRSGVTLYASRDNERVDGVLQFVTDEFGASFEQRWRRGRRLEVTYAYNFESNHTYDPKEIPDDPLLPLDLRSNLGRIQTALLFDRRPEPLNPATGTFSSVSFERAASWLLSDVAYGKILGQQYLFVPVGPLVLASRVIGGYGFGDDLLPDDRFRAGGATSVRGYGEDALGPRDIFGGARGGNRMLVMNQEARFPLYRWFHGVGFLDVGNVFDPDYPFDWSELKIGYGLGLRLDSPIGLLRLDFGVPGSTIPTSGRRPNDWSSGRWYFGLGNVF